MKLSSTLPVSLFFLCFAVSVLAADGNLQKLDITGTGPSERGGASAEALGAGVYLFGGVKEDFQGFQNTFFNDLYRFDTGDNSWSIVTPSGTGPGPRAFAASAVHAPSQRMVIFGGSSFTPVYFPFTVFDDLWAYSPASNSWEQLGTSGPRPSGRTGSNIWIQGNTMYLFGGMTQFFKFMNDLWSYDFRTDQWNELIPSGAAGSPAGRHETSSANVIRRNQLLIYGGENINYSTFEFQQLNDTWQLNLRTLTWTELTPVPLDNISSATFQAASAIVGGNLYIQGGNTTGGTTGCGAPFKQNVVSDLWRYDQARNLWTSLAPLGEPLPYLKRHSEAVVQGRLYLFLGWDFQCPTGMGNGQIFNTDVFVYSH